MLYNYLPAGFCCFSFCNIWEMQNYKAMKLTKPWTGIISFLIVLFTMPLGHAAMIIMENVFGSVYLFKIAAGLGLVGLIIIIAGNYTRNRTWATFWGLFGGLLVWTGWVEFAYVYYAHRYGVPPLVENGQIVTKPEYLIMPSSIGLLAAFMFFYLYNTYTNCNFFLWFQKHLGIHKESKIVPRKYISNITGFEMIMVLWANYIILLIAYDKNFFGDHSWFTYFVAFGSLLWSLYLFVKLLRITKWDYALRYAIPTVIIFWDFVEILGRWNLFEEIWIEPFKYWKEILLMLVVFVLLIAIIIVERKYNEKNS